MKVKLISVLAAAIVAAPAGAAVVKYNFAASPTTSGTNGIPVGTIFSGSFSYDNEAVGSSPFPGAPVALFQNTLNLNMQIGSKDYQIGGSAHPINKCTIVTQLGSGEFSFNCYEETPGVETTFVLLRLIGKSPLFTPGNLPAMLPDFGSYSLAELLVTRNGTNFRVALDSLSAEREASVPEPASLALLGLGVVGIISSRRRRA